MAENKPYWKETNIWQLKGERWKDIPDFEGIYQASSFGRVRSVDREVPHVRLYKQFVKGRLLRPSLHKNINILGKKPMIDLRVSLNKENRSYYFNVRRLVYITFVKKIDFEKDGMYVINKDGNGYNNALNNLALVTRSDKVKRSFMRKRIIPYLAYADRSKWKTNGGMSRRKPIGKYSMDGKLLKKFASITEASIKTGVGEKEIIMVAKGKWMQYRGFVWKYLEKTK